MEGPKVAGGDGRRTGAWGTLVQQAASIGDMAGARKALAELESAVQRLRQGNPLQLEGRELVRVHFGRDGRINASCYDDGCEVSLR